MNLNNYSSEIKNDDKIIKINIDNLLYQVPSFLITEKIPPEISNKLINKSLSFTRNIFLNKFFLPNNLIFPSSRIRLEGYFI